MNSYIPTLCFPTSSFRWPTYWDPLSFLGRVSLKQTNVHWSSDWSTPSKIQHRHIDWARTSAWTVIILFPCKLIFDLSKTRRHGLVSSRRGTDTIFHDKDHPCCLAFSNKMDIFSRFCFGIALRENSIPIQENKFLCTISQTVSLSFVRAVA